MIDHLLRPDQILGGSPVFRLTAVCIGCGLACDMEITPDDSEDLSLIAPGRFLEASDLGACPEPLKLLKAMIREVYP